MIRTAWARRWDFQFCHVEGEGLRRSSIIELLGAGSVLLSFSCSRKGSCSCSWAIFDEDCRNGESYSGHGKLPAPLRLPFNYQRYNPLRMMPV